MNLLRIKYTALLLAAAYLLLGVGALAADSCAESAAVLAGEPVLAAGCCGQSAGRVPANAHPCGACFDHCEPGSHSAHVSSSPFVKRFSKSLSVPLTSPASSLFAAAWHSAPPAGWQGLLPNPTLASLRTVVLLN